MIYTNIIKYVTCTKCLLNFRQAYHSASAIFALPEANKDPAFNSLRTKNSQPIRNIFVQNLSKKVNTLPNKRLKKILTRFYRKPKLRKLCKEISINNPEFEATYLSFQQLCTQDETIPSSLFTTLKSIVQNKAEEYELYPHFVNHAKILFPQLANLQKIQSVADCNPLVYVHPKATRLKRRIIFHSGPPNSGKTHNALERFATAPSGIYCAPLRLLASEIYKKTIDKGTPCNLITGQERILSQGVVNHLSCTIETVNLNVKYDVAIIDEIQMLRDNERGGAWTRALLGLKAREIHLCGEAASINIVKRILGTIGESLEVNNYERLTDLSVDTTALRSFNNISAGDCVVCFNKKDIYKVKRELEKLGHVCGIIYGALPPSVKVKQAEDFNDPQHPCNILITTDAIGMGLNLNIKRIIFYSLNKLILKDDGAHIIDVIPPYLAKQIAGRAGRYGTQYENGYVTTYQMQDFPKLKNFLSQKQEDISAAGLSITYNDLELFSSILPQCNISELVEIILDSWIVDDSLFFMINMEIFKLLAHKIQDIPLSLEARYTFCCAPVNRQSVIVQQMFDKFAENCCLDKPITFEWICERSGWPYFFSDGVEKLTYQEELLQSLDLYLWLSFKFPVIFPDYYLVSQVREELTQSFHRKISPYGTIPKPDDSEELEYQDKHDTEIYDPSHQETPLFSNRFNSNI